jgi:hypothetical protein
MPLPLQRQGLVLQSHSLSASYLLLYRSQHCLIGEIVQCAQCRFLPEAPGRVVRVTRVQRQIVKGWDALSEAWGHDLILFRSSYELKIFLSCFVE